MFLAVIDAYRVSGCRSGHPSGTHSSSKDLSLAVLACSRIWLVDQQLSTNAGFWAAATRTLDENAVVAVTCIELLHDFVALLNLQHLFNLSITLALSSLVVARLKPYLPAGATCASAAAYIGGEHFRKLSGYRKIRVYG